MIALAQFMLQSPATFYIGLGFLTVFAFGELFQQWQRRRITVRRAHLTICDFARSFERQQLDPWAVRFVWEELTALTGYPVKASDNLWTELRIDEDDIDLDWPEVVEWRLGRSFDDAPKDAKPVNTVEDLVHYIAALPVRRLPA